MRLEIIEEFYDKWNFVDKNSDMKTFKERVNATLNSCFGKKLLQEDVIKEIKFIIGSKEVPDISPFGEMSSALRLIKDEENIYILMLNESDIKKYMFYIQLIFALDSIDHQDKIDFYNSLNTCIRISRFTNIVCLSAVDNKFIVLPAGEEVLDKALINDTLNSIRNYDDLYKLYIATLQDYLYLDVESDIEKRDVADKLRLLFEKYLKERFNVKNSKIADVIKNNVQPLLEENGINMQIRNMYFQLGNTFEKYSNDKSKHEVGEISVEELEFLVYLVGSFIRLIYKIDSKNHQLNNKIF